MNGGSADVVRALEALSQALAGVTALLSGSTGGGNPGQLPPGMPGQVPPRVAPGAPIQGGGPGAQLRIPATGKPEIRQVTEQTGAQRTAYFDARGSEITAFQYTSMHQFKVKLSGEVTPKAALANITLVSDARRERTRLLANDMANDAKAQGAVNPVDQQLLHIASQQSAQLDAVIQQLTPHAFKLTPADAQSLNAMAAELNGGSSFDLTQLQALVRSIATRPLG